MTESIKIKRRNERTRNVKKRTRKGTKKEKRKGNEVNLLRKELKKVENSKEKEVRLSGKAREEKEAREAAGMVLEEIISASGPLFILVVVAIVSYNWNV